MSFTILVAAWYVFVFTGPYLCITLGYLPSVMGALLFVLAASSALVRSRLPLLTIVRIGNVGVNKMKFKNTEELTKSHKAPKCDPRIHTQIRPCACVTRTLPKTGGNVRPQGRE